MQFKFNDESFRDDYSYKNSAAAIKRFPFPFAEDHYMYSVNIEPHTKGKAGSVYEFPFDIDEHYVAECLDKLITLEKDPGRYSALPHMMDAQWDFLELSMSALANDYPDYFTLTKNGNVWTWENRPLDIMDTFTFGDATTLPAEPFEYIGRQMQGDFVLLDQRDGTLYSDAGLVTSQADWSLAFNTGMSWQEWHGPVPKVTEMGVLDRALKYLLNLQAANPVRRLNWTMTIHPRLDTSPENYPFWGGDRNKVNAETVGDLVNLRVELQSLFRLPRSNAIVFGVRCYLISLKDLTTYPRWAKRLHRVQKDLHPDLIEYKGMTKYHPYVIEWLSQFDDGAELEIGSHPE
ncbi:MAG: heme-dependent oxidative N-demethylase family protein [Methylophilus sp.]|uniref:heme-dependent oxidative N-demethylase family protein n=1 Tax=Methylophilus sp. TaxID=29541 RepID=UPI003FA0CD73